jgi:hypothetical protein
VRATAQHLVTLVGKIVLDGLCILSTNLIGMGYSAFFHNCQPPAVEVDLCQIEVRHRGSAHPGFNQRIDDGAVAIALAAGALPRLIALAIFRASANRQEQIGGIEQASALSRGEGPVHLQAGAEGREFDSGHGMP